MPLLTLLYYQKPCIYRAIAARPGSITLLLKEPDYSLFRLLSALLPGNCRIVGLFGCCLPAAAHSRAVSYSCGLFLMHNVVASSSGLWPEYLDLSNTLLSEKTLSSSKPPHRFHSLVTFQTVLDGTPLLARVEKEPFRVPLDVFRTVPDTVRNRFPPLVRFLSNLPGQGA